MKKLFLLLPLLTSCSVMMASNRGGADIDSVQSLSNRSQFIALGADPIESNLLEDGNRVETFRIEQKHGSIARAFMHGLLDIGTGFLWEFAGTPIESTLNQKKFYTVKVTFDSEEQIKKMELL
jgi:hypothetical protein